jgi:toxin ParE1/3/4
MRIRYLKAALSDLEQIRRFIRQSNPLTAQRVVTEIREQVAKLSTFSARFREGSVEGTRELVIVRYGYIVTYRIDSSAITILSVFHAAQDKSRGA